MFDVVCTTINGGIPIFYRKNSKTDSVSAENIYDNIYSTWMFIPCLYFNRFNNFNKIKKIIIEIVFSNP